MKFFLACFVWLAIGTVLGAGIWLMAVKGNPWLLVVSSLAFIGGIWKVGCTSH